MLKSKHFDWRAFEIRYKIRSCNINKYDHFCIFKLNVIGSLNDVGVIWSWFLFNFRKISSHINKKTPYRWCRIRCIQTCWEWRVYLGSNYKWWSTVEKMNSILYLLMWKVSAFIYKKPLQGWVFKYMLKNHSFT